MAYPVSKVIKLAQNEVGYLEKASNSNLDDKTANAGKNNFTKYARDLSNAGYYNGNKNGFAWCDVFVDWLFYKAFGKEIGQKLECQTGDLGAGCYYSAKYYENQKRLFKKPKIGDQIFFKDSNGDPCHTGIVVDVTSSSVITIEGNTSSSIGVVANGGCVAKKSYSLEYSRIYGYGRPKYDMNDVKSSAETTTTKKEYVTVELVKLKSGSTGAAVKALQILLNGFGYSCGTVDGDFGSKTLAAVKKFQKAKGIDVDGIVGAQTWNKLLK